MQLIKAANNISEKAISNSNKPVKIVYLRKLANQSLLHGAHVIEMATASKVVFMKARKSTKRETCQLKRKITRWWKYIYIYIYIFQAFPGGFWLTPKLIRRVRERQGCLWPTFY